MPSPEAEALLANLKPGLALPGEPVALVREKMHRIHPTQVPEDATLEPQVLGGIEAAWLRTPAVDDAERCVFHVHGGAYVSTGREHYSVYAASISRAVRARVLVHSYRWAPEHPYPAALDDTHAVYRALLDLGVSPGRMALTGDSCGGGIALALLLRLRDAGEPLPAAYAGLTPWLDLECSGESAREPRGVDPFVEPDWIRERGLDYVGRDGDLRDPQASPLHGDFAGLPPLFFSVGEIDTTRDDSTRVAARAGRDGVDVTLEVNAGMIHGFHGLAELLPEGRASLERMGEFVRRHTG